MDDSGAPIRYYMQMAEVLKNEERSTLQVDFSHMSSFQFGDAHFMDQLLQEFGRYEPYLRKAVTQFLNGLGYPLGKNRFFQLAIYNLP